MAFNQVSGQSVALVVAVVIMAVGAIVLNGFANGLPTKTTASVAWNATQYGLGGLQTFGSWFGTVVLVVIGVILLTLVLRGFGQKASA